ncbi:hypothetical protein LAD12857_45270 [Lacrimispora amygdalina]|uniref:Uncharacterized protein n=1 Tax=Lacrimispora amygdalina TaxID=253257 RepID=A0ABQ5MCN2_9FIRM
MHWLDVDNLVKEMLCYRLKKLKRSDNEENKYGKENFWKNRFNGSDWITGRTFRFPRHV